MTERLHFTSLEKLINAKRHQIKEVTGDEGPSSMNWWFKYVPYIENEPVLSRTPSFPTHPFIQ